MATDDTVDSANERAEKAAKAALEAAREAKEEVAEFAAQERDFIVDPEENAGNETLAQRDRRVRAEVDVAVANEAKELAENEEVRPAAAPMPPSTLDPERTKDDVLDDVREEREREDKEEAEDDIEAVRDLDLEDPDDVSSDEDASDDDPDVIPRDDQ